MGRCNELYQEDVPTDLGSQAGWHYQLPRSYRPILLPSALALGLAVVPSEAGIFAYITTGDTVSVVDTATDTVVANIPVGGNPFDVVVHPDRTRVYVANRDFAALSR